MKSLTDKAVYIDRQFTCPKCGSHYFGTCGEVNKLMGYCEGTMLSDGNKRCPFTWPRSNDQLYFKPVRTGTL